MPDTKADVKNWEKGAQIIREGYNKQKTMFDKAWFLINTMAQSAIGQTSKEDGNAIGGDERVDAEYDMMDSIRDDFVYDLLGDATLLDIKRAFKALGIVQAQIALEIGDEYKRVYDELKKREDMMTPEEKAKDPTITNDPKVADKFRERKARYIIHYSEGKSKYLSNAFNALLSGGGIQQCIIQNEKIQDKVWSGVRYNRDMTVSDFLDRIGDTKDNKDEFYKSYNCKPTDTIYSAVMREEIRSRRAKNQPVRVSSREVDGIIRRMAVETIITDTLNRYNGEYLVTSYLAKGKAVGLSNKEQFEEGKYIYSGKLTLPGGVEVSVNDGDSADRTTDPLEKAEIKKDIEIFHNWTKNEGAKIIEQSKPKGMEEYRRLTTTIYADKKLNMAENKNFIKLHYDEISGADTSFLRGMIRDLESTGTLGRKKNTDEYDNMLKALKEYEKEVSRNNPMAAMGAKNALRKAATKYIQKGKDKVRHNPGGRKRFDDAMLIMSELLPEEDFRKMVSLINGVRKAKPGDKAYIDYDNIYGKKNETGGVRQKIRMAEREREDEIQRSTKKNAIKLYASDVEKMASMDSHFSTDKKFLSVGPFREESSLSDKDFAALAYAGVLTPEALALDERFGELSFEEKLMRVGSDHTSRLYGKELSSEKKPIQKAGIENAEKAMAAYEKGDKEPLAKLIATGLKNIGNLAYNDKDLNGKQIVNAEMSTRLINMLSRDPELSKLAHENGLDNSVCKNYDTLRASADIISKSRKAFVEFDDYHVFNKPEKERIELMTDLLMPHSVVFCSNHLSSVKGGEKFKNYNLVEDLKKPEEMKEFREVVRQFVKRNDLQNTTANRVVEKYKDSQSFIRELSAITKNHAKKQVEKHAKRTASLAKSAGNKAKPEVKGRSFA